MQQWLQTPGAKPANRPALSGAVAAQTYPHREHVVVDGASTDGTVALLEQRSGKLARWVSEPDQGIYDALKKGLRMSRGDVVGFLHADDVFGSPQVLEQVAAAFVADAGLAAVFGDLQYVRKDDLGHVVRHWRSTPFTPRAARVRLLRRCLRHMSAVAARCYDVSMIDWSSCIAVERDPGRVSGAWVFCGTRVPISALFENLEDGASVHDFVAWFPGVLADQARAVLEHAAKSTLEVA